MTAAQMVIDAFYKYRYDNPHLIELFNVAIDKEKQQIKDGYNQGFKDGLNECKDCGEVWAMDLNVQERNNAEDYFNQTFKQVK
jgi:hypothetical protein